MVIDHLGGGSWLYPLTGGNRFFVSAAEGFIFLSGLMVGFIYGPRIARDGLAAVQVRLLRRALTLYVTTLGLTFTFVGLSRLAGMPWLQDVAPLTPSLAVSLLTLHHTYYLVDVMLLYTVVLTVAPIALLLLNTGKTYLVVGFSVALWGLHLFFPAETAMPWNIVNNDTFQIAAWQLWFFGGMVIGYHRESLWRRLRRLPLAPSLAVLVLLAAALIALRIATPDASPAAIGATGGETAGVTAAASGGLDFGNARSFTDLVDLIFDKHLAAPGRVVAFAIFFPLFYLVLTYAWRPFERVTGWLLLPFGQNALYVYSLHLYAIFFSALLLPYVPGFDRFNPLLNTPVQIAAVLIIWLMVKRQVLFDIVPR